MICCAKCHFHPFQFLSSISQPPSWKMLPVAKTPKNSTLQAIFIKNRIESYFILLFHTISHSVVMTTKKYVSKKWDTYARVRYYTLFGKHSLHILPTYIYFLSQYHLPYLYNTTNIYTVYTYNIYTIINTISA